MKSITIREVILIFIIGILLLLYTCNESNTGTIPNSYLAELQKSRNERLQETAKIRILETDYRTLKELHKHTRDSLLKELSLSYDKNTTFTAGTKTETHNKGTVETIVKENIITKVNTVTKHDSINVYPTYIVNVSNKWIDLHVEASRDSSSYDVKIRNEFITSIKKEKSQSILYIKNLNPYTSTTEMIPYQLKENKPKRLVWLGAGVLLGAVGILLLTR